MFKKLTGQQKIVMALAAVVIVLQIVLYFRYRAFGTHFPYVQSLGMILLFLGLAVPVDEPKVPLSFRIRMILIAFALASFSFDLGKSF